MTQIKIHCGNPFNSQLLTIDVEKSTPLGEMLSRTLEVVNLERQQPVAINDIMISYLHTGNSVNFTLIKPQEVIPMWKKRFSNMINGNEQRSSWRITATTLEELNTRTLGDVGIDPNHKDISKELIGVIRPPLMIA